MSTEIYRFSRQYSSLWMFKIISKTQVMRLWHIYFQYRILCVRVQIQQLFGVFVISLDLITCSIFLYTSWCSRESKHSRITTINLNLVVFLIKMLGLSSHLCVFVDLPANFGLKNSTSMPENTVTFTYILESIFYTSALKAFTVFL